MIASWLLWTLGTLCCGIILLIVAGEHYGATIVTQGGYPRRHFFGGGFPFLQALMLNGCNGLIGWCLPRANNKPFLDWRVMVPEAALLQEEWQTIREEALNVYKRAPMFDDVDNLERGLVQGDGGREWRSFVFKFHRGWHLQHCQLCPVTARLLKRIPSLRLAMFSIFAPGKQLMPHTGPWRGIARLHLGLVIPQHKTRKVLCPVLMVAGQRYYWREGELVLFDDTFVHEAWNPTDSWRIVLFCDIERPDLPRVVEVVKNVLGASYFQEVNVRAEELAVRHKKFG